jgi:hypothetical protein
LLRLGFRPADLAYNGHEQKANDDCRNPCDKSEQAARRSRGDILLGRHGDDNRNVHGTPKLNALGGGAAAEVFESS